MGDVALGARKSEIPGRNPEVLLILEAMKYIHDIQSSNLENSLLNAEKTESVISIPHANAHLGAVKDALVTALWY